MIDESFMDTSSTALIAPVTYRMAVFEKDTSLISSASHALKFVQNDVDADGRLQNIVTVKGPIMFHGPVPPAEHSPEGQAFIFLLQAAWHSSFYLHANPCGL